MVSLKRKSIYAAGETATGSHCIGGRLGPQSQYPHHAGKKITLVRSEVFTAGTIKNGALWDMWLL
jgi:hypothetical protein